MKISHAGQAGKLAYARVFGGPLADSDQLTLSDGSTQRPGALFSVQGAQTKKVSRSARRRRRRDRQARSGRGGRSSVHERRAEAEHRSRTSAFPVYQLAIATKDRKDDVRLSGALQKLVEEDAGLSVLTIRSRTKSCCRAKASRTCASCSIG